MAKSGAKTGQGKIPRPPIAPPAIPPASGVIPMRGRGEWSADQKAKLPQRYQIRESEELRYLRCREAPGLGVSIDHSYSISEAEARKLGRQVILLDGAGCFEPTLDDGRQLYNLDHHAGCLRAFTLATCEQALILVLKGLELDKGDWKIYAGEPDLDTVLAIWVLLNHRRLKELTPAARDRIVPLLRLEGSIDANGFEVAEYCGLSQAMVAVAKEQLDGLLEQEMAVKKSGDWGEDPVGYTLAMLSAIDRLVYTPADFADFAAVEEEYGHVEVGDLHVAVICRDASGIYEVEKRLKQSWGDRLGIIALEKSPGHFTLRRVAALAGIDLHRAYGKLNLLDPIVDGRPPEKRWGGSDDIGGSPKGVGTGLEPKDIRQILRLAFQPTTGWEWSRQLLRGLLGSAAAAAAAVAAWFLCTLVLEVPGDPIGMAARVSAMAALALVVVGGFTLYFSDRRPWFFGWRWPGGYDWLLVAPLVILAAVLGAAWLPSESWMHPAPGLQWGARELIATSGAMVLVAVALEGTFRGMVHGLFLLIAPVQRVGGRWFVSRAVWISALFYTLALGVGWWLGGVRLPFTPPLWPTFTSPLVVLALGFAAGVGLGLIRERSASVWPPILVQGLGLVFRLMVAFQLTSS